ncbi:MAG TPA: OmpH family outer membrane protein [Syntrophomonas sp.]|nr:OmpH family outer membrane protein [Syntrophomonas sp.]
MFLFACGATSFAQQKIGHINTQDVLQLMPERDSAAKVFDKFNEEINKNFESMKVAYNNALDAFTKQKDSLSPFLRDTKQQEIIDMQGKIENFKVAAQQELQKKQDDLMAPIVEKLKKAIKAVAEEHKFTYVLDSGSLLFVPDDESLNLLPLVKAKLGIK